jgi:dTDP-4-dehydrorhamnose reductase
MVILITGGNGQLGRELSRILETGESELGKLPAPYEAATVHVMDEERLDITDGDGVASWFSCNRPALVFNCAAMTDVDGCETNEEKAYRINAEGPANLAKASEKSGSRLIHVSTDYVFSGNATRPYREEDDPAPATAYGRTKLAGEQAVSALCADSCICRTAWLYGYDGHNFPKTILRLARERGRLDVVDDQVGNPTCAVDLAYQMALLAVSGERGIFHCTCAGEPVSWHSFAERILCDAGLASVSVQPCTSASFPRPAHRPAYSALDNGRLRATIGDSMRRWDEALDRFMANYLAMEAR